MGPVYGNMEACAAHRSSTEMAENENSSPYMTMNSASNYENGIIFILALGFWIINEHGSISVCTRKVLLDKC